MALPVSSGFLRSANPLADSLDRVPGSFHRLGDGRTNDSDRPVPHQPCGLDRLLGQRLNDVRDFIRRSGRGVREGLQRLADLVRRGPHGIRDPFDRRMRLVRCPVQRRDARPDGLPGRRSGLRDQTVHLAPRGATHRTIPLPRRKFGAAFGAVHFHYRQYNELIVKIYFAPKSHPVQRTHLELGDRVHDARRVRFHDSRVHLRHIPPVRSGGRRETTRQCIRKLFLRAQLMVHDRPLRPEGREGHVEVFAGIEVAHDHPVRDAARHDVAAIPQEGDHVRRPIQSNVSDQVLKADRIQFTRVHDLGVRAQRNRECEVADPREQVSHDGSRSDAVRDPESFFDVTRRKHHTCDVEGIANPALQIHRLRPLSPEHLKIWNELKGHQFLEEILRVLPRDREDRHASRERNRGFHSFARYTPRYVYEGRPTSARNMRAPALALSLLLIATLLLPAAAAEDFGAVVKVNKLVRVQETPELAPGESGRFVFYFNSTYTEPMRNVRLNASIYRYATIDESVPVDSAWPYAYPRIAETGTKEWVWTNATVASGSSRSLSFTVLTAPDSHDMPHGSIFSQSSYFLRFWLEFDGNVTGNLFRMVSPGFFTRAQGLAATIPEADPCSLPNCRGHLNVTMLAGFLGVSLVDGIIPDSAVVVKEPIPRLPFYLLTALVVFFLLLAFLFWVEANPGTFPRVETWWARTRGRLARTVAPLRPHRRPKA